MDLPTYHLDLTPFIPILTDGEPHNITLDVASAEDDHQINQNWFVSGLLQVKLDPSNLPTTGRITQYEASSYATSSVSAAVSGEDVNITVTASRNVRIKAEIIGGSGARTEVVFTQALLYGNEQSYLQNTTILVRPSAHSDNVRTDVREPEPLPARFWLGLVETQWRDSAEGHLLVSTPYQHCRSTRQLKQCVFFPPYPFLPTSLPD